MQIDDNVYRLLTQVWDEKLERDLFGISTAASGTDNLSLLIPVYYAMSEFFKPSEFIRMSKGKYSPAFIAFHPSDFETVKAKLPSGCKLVPLSEAPVVLPDFIEVRAK